MGKLLLRHTKIEKSPLRKIQSYIESRKRSLASRTWWFRTTYLNSRCQQGLDVLCMDLCRLESNSMAVNVLYPCPMYGANMHCFPRVITIRVHKALVTRLSVRFTSRLIDEICITDHIYNTLNSFLFCYWYTDTVFNLFVFICKYVFLFFVIIFQIVSH